MSMPSVPSVVKKLRTRCNELGLSCRCQRTNKYLPQRVLEKMLGGGSPRPWIRSDAGDPIEDSDVMYKDEYVSILRPEVKKGVIIWSHYIQPEGVPSLCDSGLKTGSRLHEEGFKIRGSVNAKIHPYIFFKAPHFANKIDYTDPVTEINSLYGNLQEAPRVYIRVDPDETYVFSSEIRVHKPDDLMESKKTLSDYLTIIDYNRSAYPKGTRAVYNLFSSYIKGYPARLRVQYPLNEYPIERNSEILVAIPHLTPEYYVHCT